MHQAAQAYSRTAQATVSPRQLEASLLLKAAAKIQTIKDEWPSTSTDLYEALYFNRKLWTILVTSATKEDNPLPHAIKQNIANLAMFVFDRTVEIQIHPEATALDILVTVNREIAAGLQA
ncbi:MAG: flagellar biosynthesis regulator FlaF [Fimbriimonadaceae bacterium]|nr:flagellar biosynthesis regulator FlaF [Alphaproteobacteria bacterium]